MTYDRKKQLIQKAAIARKQIGIDDDAYRALLSSRFGKSSSTKLSIEELANLLNLYIEKYGWKPTPAKTKKPTATQQKGKGYQGEFIKLDVRDPLGPQKRYALALAKMLGWKLSGLDTRCKTQFGVERFQWIRKQGHMQVLINDMVTRCQKRGIDPTPQS